MKPRFYRRKENMMNWIFEKLKYHIGHKITCVAYGGYDNPSDICIECEDCNEVLISSESITTEE